MYNYDYKKINKLPLNPYNQLLVHNVASTFLGKRCDRYGVRIFFPVLKLDQKQQWLSECSWDPVPLKRALETDCNALSTKRELPTLNFSFC